MQAFSLTKWYVDCVAEDGSTAIAYWSAIAWHGLELTSHSVSLRPIGAEPLERSSAKSVPPPASDGGTITWDAVPLACRLTCQSLTPAFTTRLLDCADGTVEWHCESARGDVSVECSDRETLRGAGYVECLNVTLPPWRLPIDTLRWGHWMSASSSRSVVWIDWCGPRPLTLLVVDGQLRQAGLVGDERIEAEDVALTLTDRHTLYSRSLLDTMGVLGPVLGPLLPTGWLAMEDRKWRSRGTLYASGRPDESGWVIHETVRWPS